MELKEMALDIMEAVCETDELRDDPDMNLFEAGLIDSLLVISIILEIENRMKIKLQPTDFEKNDISSVNNFITFLEKTRNK